MPSSAHRADHIGEVVDWEAGQNEANKIMKRGPYETPTTHETQCTQSRAQTLRRCASMMSDIEPPRDVEDIMIWAEKARSKMNEENGGGEMSAK